MPPILTYCTICEPCLTDPPTAPAAQSVVNEKYFTDPHHFWTDANRFPLNYYVPLKHVLVYTSQIGFYLQARRRRLLLFGCVVVMWRACAGGASAPAQLPVARCPLPSCAS